MTTKDHFSCNLEIKQFELPVFLGWPHDERHQVQTVSIDIHISYPAPPLACTSDKLEDTLCYSWLTDQIREKIANHSFHLLEHLVKTVHTILINLLPDALMISVAINKKPTIEGLKGGVTFSCVSFKESTSS